MSLYLVSIALTVGANVAYHLCQKEVRADVSPLYSLAASYFVGLLITIALIFAFPKFGGGVPAWREVQKLNWASYALGFALVGLELGFLLAYRSGWKISFAALVSNVAVTVLLIPIGLAFYRESLGATKGIGIALSLAGLWLLSKR